MSIVKNYAIIVLVVSGGIHNPLALFMEASMKKINISTEKYPNIFTLVDDEDHECLNKWKWAKLSNGYAVRGTEINYIKKTYLMHREIMKVSENNLVIDHINHNKLDNRKCNLRVCTRLQNSHNKRLNYGVDYLGKDRYGNDRYRARIMNNRKTTHIGMFDNIKDAIKARKCVARIFYGEFAD